MRARRAGDQEEVAALADCAFERGGEAEDGLFGDGAGGGEVEAGEGVVDFRRGGGGLGEGSGEELCGLVEEVDAGVEVGVGDVGFVGGWAGFGLCHGGGGGGCRVGLGGTSRRVSSGLVFN